VILRGLYVNGLGGNQGIFFGSGQTFHLESCVVTGFSQNGVYSASPGAHLYINDTTSRQNNAGFYLQSGSATIRVNADNILAEENVFGVAAGANALITVTRGVVAGNYQGFFTDEGGNSVMNLESCTATFNVNGIYSNGTIRVANSMITGNVTGVFHVGSGTTVSSGNNRLNGNTTNGTFTTTVPVQ
jgi:hypothetical protein